MTGLFSVFSPWKSAGTTISYNWGAGAVVKHWPADHYAGKTAITECLLSSSCHFHLRKKSPWILTSTLAGTVTAIFSRETNWSSEKERAGIFKNWLKGHLHLLQPLLPKDFRIGRNLKCSPVLWAGHTDLHYNQPRTAVLPTPEHFQGQKTHSCFERSYSSKALPYFE